MNTKDSKIQWHPAFDAALQIELAEEAKYLTFFTEMQSRYSLSLYRNYQRRIITGLTIFGMT